MRIGVVYPQIELGGDPEAVRCIGSTAEQLGYSHLMAYDHVLGAVHDGRQPRLTGPYKEDDPFHEPLVMFAYLSGRCERLGFVSGVMVLPQRQTALVARQAADVALLAGLDAEGGHRLRLGVGVGWNHVEYEALGQDFRTRGDRLDEQIELLRRLWTEPVVSFDGRFDTVDRAGSCPRPAQPIPIWIGGWADAALERAARVGDGFIFAGTGTTIPAQWSRLKALLAEHGRTVTGFGAEAMVTGHADPLDAVRFTEQWAAIGGTHAAICTMGLGLDSVDAHVDYMHVVADELAQRGALRPPT